MLTVEDNEMLTRTGPGTSMGVLFRRFWMPALLSEELAEPDGVPVRLRIMGEDLVAFRDTLGRVGVLDAFCPHRRARLFFGRNEDCGLRCTYHGWKYDVDGQCVDQPSEPLDSVFKEKVHIKTYPSREWGGVVWIYMGPAELMPELPQFEWCRVPPSHRLVSRWIQESNYCQAQEGEIDPSHGRFVHQWFDSTVDPRSGRTLEGDSQEKPTPRFRGQAPQITVKEVDHGVVSGSYLATGEGQYRWRVNRWLLPIFSLIAASSYPVGGRCWVPIDDEHITVFQYLWNPDRPLTEEEISRLQPNGSEEREYSPKLERSAYKMPDGYIIDTWRDGRNKDNDYLVDRDLQRSKNFTGIPAQRTQDASVVETQGLGAIADRSLEYLGSSDKTIIAMRQRMLEVARELEDGVEPYGPSHADVFHYRALEVVSRQQDLDRLLEEQGEELVAKV
jgi:phenylpropionate dioxygenase-like ring-hydroxylating dioxygenase large terminal subunit